MADVDIPDFKDPNFPLRIFTDRDVEAINEKLCKTRADRVRAALFPETLADPDKVPSTQMNPNVPTAIQVLTPPSMQLRDAIEDILNYQLDADFASKFIPEIVKLLSDSDLDVVRNAAELTRDLTNSEAACTVVTKSPQLVTALLKAIGAAVGDSKNELLVKEGACGALLNLSKYESGRLTIFKTGGIAILVKLLEAPAERVVNYAISTIHNLLNYQEGAKVAVRMVGGIQKMVPLLRWKDQKFLAVNIDCLYMMAYGDLESKLAIWNCKGPKELVTVFKARVAEEQLLRTTIRLLKVLSADLHNKEQIVESGGFEAIVARLDERRDPKLFQNYLTTLRNLSDADANFRCDESLISYLLQFLKHNEEEVVLFMAQIFANLSAKKPRIKVALFKTGGIEFLLQMLMTAQSDEMKEPLLRCLRHLTSPHPMTMEAQSEFRRLGGLELSMQVFHLATTWPIIKAACGLVRNLANCMDNHQVLVELKVMPKLGQVLAMAFKQEMTLQSTKSLSRHSSLIRGSKIEDPEWLIDGVDMSDVIESSVATLSLLATASMINRDSILELNIAPLLNRLKDDKETMEDVVIACKALLDSLGLSERSRASIISTSSRSQRSDQESLRDRDRPESVKELGSTASLPPTPSVDKYRQQEQYPRWPEVPVYENVAPVDATELRDCSFTEREETVPSGFADQVQANGGYEEVSEIKPESKKDRKDKKAKKKKEKEKEKEREKEKKSKKKVAEPVWAEAEV